MADRIKGRRPWVAALLSLLMMGLGQLYNGQPRRAAAFLAFSVVSFVATNLLAPALLSFQGLMILYTWIVVVLGIRGFAIVDAFIGARRLGSLQLRRYNRWYVYVAIFLIVTMVQVPFETPTANFSIPSASMSPTVQIGDYLIADRNAYRRRAPTLGDVVVFKHPKDEEIDYIKRVVGLPGDTVQISNGTLQINGTPVERRLLRDLTLDDSWAWNKLFEEYVETLPNGRAYQIWEESDRSLLDNTPVYEVPEGHYFVVGDNRYYSQDSRHQNEFGFLPARNIIGRAEVIYFSTNDQDRWWQVWRWPTIIRFSRIGLELN